MQFIRTGSPLYEEYWIRRSNIEINSPLDRRILFKQSTLPGHYKPFPQFTFEANEFLDDWIEFEIRGERILALKAIPGLDFSNLQGSPSITPIITLTDIINFNKYIANRVMAIQRDFESRKQAELKAIMDQTIDQNNTDLAKEHDELQASVQLHKNESISAAKKVENLEKTKNDLQAKLKEEEDRNKELTKENAAHQTKNQKLNKKNDEIKKKLEDLEKDINRIREQRNKYDNEARNKSEEIRRLQETANRKGPTKRPRTDYNQQNYDQTSNDRQNYNRPNYDKPNYQANKWNQANTRNRQYDQPKGHQPTGWSQNQPSSTDLTQRELDIKDRELTVRDKEIEILKATLNQRNALSSTDQELKIKEKELELMKREKALANQGMEHRNFQPTSFQPTNFQPSNSYGI